MCFLYSFYFAVILPESRCLPKRSLFVSNVLYSSSDWDFDYDNLANSENIVLFSVFSIQSKGGTSICISMIQLYGKAVWCFAEFCNKLATSRLKQEKCIANIYTSFSFKVQSKFCVIKAEEADFVLYSGQNNCCVTPPQRDVA